MKIMDFQLRISSKVLTWVYVGFVCWSVNSVSFCQSYFSDTGGFYTNCTHNGGKCRKLPCIRLNDVIKWNRFKPIIIRRWIQWHTWLMMIASTVASAPATARSTLSLRATASTWSTPMLASTAALAPRTARWAPRFRPNRMKDGCVRHGRAHLFLLLEEIT